MVDRLRSGFFTWYRGQQRGRGRGTAALQATRHCAHDPLSYSRSGSFGPCQPVHEVQVVCWLLEQAWRCSSQLLSVLLEFPEDFGGDQVSGPASISALQELRCLDGLDGVQRGAAFVFELADSEQRRPLVLHTNLQLLNPLWRFGWLHRAFLHLRRPTPVHLPMHDSACSFPWNQPARGGQSLLPQYHLASSSGRRVWPQFCNMVNMSPEGWLSVFWYVFPALSWELESHLVSLLFTWFS